MKWCDNWKKWSDGVHSLRLNADMRKQTDTTHTQLLPRVQDVIYNIFFYYLKIDTKPNIIIVCWFAGAIYKRRRKYMRLPAVKYIQTRPKPVDNRENSRRTLMPLGIISVLSLWNCFFFFSQSKTYNIRINFTAQYSGDGHETSARAE